MTVARIKDEGKYFHACDDELEALFGQEDLNGDIMEVVKVGSQRGWNIAGMTDMDIMERSLGHLHPWSHADKGDWKVGDKILSKDCYLGNYIILPRQIISKYVS